MIQFDAVLLRPAGPEKSQGWMFLTLPEKASKAMPSRGLVSVRGQFNGKEFAATLSPDGEGGHWFKVPTELSKNYDAGQTVHLEIEPSEVEPEPEVPQDLREALGAAPQLAQAAWADITPTARRDWIHWMTSGKKAETRVKRITAAMDMLSKGKRRPCCFDRSGQYSNSLSCPVADGQK
ncbi:MAG TPA: YdeI/OmpD-associated family protein [Fimbriimonadaceae bacterium]|nr:YdeI/OmpD-associated family protein [Fimbriimonadaceae bacterium]